MNLFHGRGMVTVAGTLTAAFSVACATTHTRIESACGVKNPATCVQDVTAPDYRVYDFGLAAGLAVDVVLSEPFHRAVSEFVAMKAADPRISADWKGWTGDSAVAALRRGLPGSSLGTKDGPWAWFVHLDVMGIGFGEVAIEADSASGKPARINRWALPGLSVAGIANSIVHEAAHKAGMSHLGDYRDCGPPYVLGELVERLATQDAVNPDALCVLPPISLGVGDAGQKQY